MLADYINIALLVVAIVGITLTYFQARSSARTARASFLKDLYSALTTDPDIGHAYYLVEYGRFNYGPDFHGSEVEPKIDRLMALADLVCELHDQHVISSREMDFFAYRFQRIASDAGIREYLEFLSGYYESLGMEKEPFHSFTAYARNSLIQAGK